MEDTKSKSKPKYNSILLDKFLDTEGYNWLSQYKKQHPIFKLLTYDHFRHWFFNKIPLNFHMKTPSDTTEQVLNINQEIKAQEKDITQSYSTDYSNSIKNELNKQLNPFKSHLPEEQEFTLNIQAVASKLQKIIKMKDLDTNFFINFLHEIKKGITTSAQVEISNAGKTVEEVINSVVWKCEIIRTLRHYQPMDFLSRVQIRIQSGGDDYTTEDSEAIFNWMVIDLKTPRTFNELYNWCSSKNEKKRRPVGKCNNVFNYLPIHCKGECMRSAEKVYHILIDFINNKCHCNECWQISNNIKEYAEKNKFTPNIIELEILDCLKCWYYKTCIFAHNYNEIAFHPLKYRTQRCWDNNCNYYHCPNYHLNRNKTNRWLYSDAEYEEVAKGIYKFITWNKFKPINERSHIKTEKCPWKFNGDKELAMLHNVNACPYYHNLLERRRDDINIQNKICPFAVDVPNKHWKESNSCNKGDFCNFYHTRNEVLFDKRNYRKIYDCTSPCFYTWSELCPFKHSTNIDIEGWYWPETAKELIREKMRKIKSNEAMINYYQGLFKYFYCILCRRHDMDNWFVFKCKHILCDSCYNKAQRCLICDDKNNKYNTVVQIKLKEVVEAETEESIISESKNNQMDITMLAPNQSESLDGLGDENEWEFDDDGDYDSNQDFELSSNGEIFDSMIMNGWSISCSSITNENSKQKVNLSMNESVLSSDGSNQGNNGESMMKNSMEGAPEPAEWSISDVSWDSNSKQEIDLSLVTNKKKKKNKNKKN